MSSRISSFILLVTVLFATSHSAPLNDTLLSKDNHEVPSFTDIKWEAFIAEIQNANSEFIKGEMEGTRNVWSHSNDATIFGGFGGLVEPGWQNVESRLLWAAKQFTGGTYSYKKIKSTVNGTMGYVLQTEQWVVPGKPTMNLRVTMICQLESNGWKIVHRHGEIIKPEKTGK